MYQKNSVVHGSIVLTVKFTHPVRMFIQCKQVSLLSDLERHIVAEDEKVYLKEKGVNSDEIQGKLSLLNVQCI